MSIQAWWVSIYTCNCVCNQFTIKIESMPGKWNLEDFNLIESIALGDLLSNLIHMNNITE